MSIFKEGFLIHQLLKKSNVYDRSIDQYIDEKNKLAQLLESERIKEY